MFVDSHCHTFVTNLSLSEFPVELLLTAMDRVGVERGVVLQGPYYGDGNAYVASVCRVHADRLAAMAYLDPWVQGAQERLKSLMDQGVFRGLKLECSVPTGLLGLHPHARLDAPEVSWLWGALERNGWMLTVDLGGPGTASYQTAAVEAIAQAHPRLQVVIAHLGQPSAAVREDRAMRALWEEQLSLGVLANVWFDTAALPAFYRGEGFPWPGAGAALREAVARIGAGKLLWGSDIPGLLEHAAYPRLLEYAQEALSALGEEERARIFGENAARIYFREG
jgi:predicted TIM-barrel fold metal-dependent hydrolase